MPPKGWRKSAKKHSSTRKPRGLDAQIERDVSIFVCRGDVRGQFEVPVRAETYNDAMVKAAEQIEKLFNSTISIKKRGAYVRAFIPTPTRVEMLTLAEISERYTKEEIEQTFGHLLKK